MEFSPLFKKLQLWFLYVWFVHIAIGHLGWRLAVDSHGTVVHSLLSKRPGLLE